MQLSEAAKNLKPGVYEHFKGKRYEVLGAAHHSETLEEMVVYRALYGEKDLWVRPLAMFLETVERDGHPSTLRRAQGGEQRRTTKLRGGSEHSRTSQKVPRFKFVR